MIRILRKLLFSNVKGNDINFFYDYYEYITKTIINEGRELLDLLEKTILNIPILLFNGKEDNIASYEMSLNLHQKISYSKLVLLDNFGHGSVLLGKGNKKIIEEYVKLIKF